MTFRRIHESPIAVMQGEQACLTFDRNALFHGYFGTDILISQELTTQSLFAFVGPPGGIIHGSIY